nr:HepT-like ribonuclease domain-containing protein [Cellulomonas sp. IC4_254]
MDDPAGFDAACLRLAAAIDCLAGLPAAMRDEICGGDWFSVRSTRNRIVHGYFAVESDVVREAVARDLVPLRARLLAAAEAIGTTT